MQKLSGLHAKNAKAQEQIEKRRVMAQKTTRNLLVSLVVHRRNPFMIRTSQARPGYGETESYMSPTLPLRCMFNPAEQRWLL